MAVTNPQESIRNLMNKGMGKYQAIYNSYQQAGQGGYEQAVSNMIADSGFTPTPQLISTIINAVRTNPSMSMDDFAGAFKANPAMYGGMEVQQQQYQKLFNTAYNDPNNPANLIAGSQQQQLGTNIGQVQQRANEQLLSQMGARGLTPTGGAYAGGVAKTAENLGGVMQQGTSAIQQQRAQNVGQEASGYQATNNQDIANLLANQYQEQMAQQYYQQMQQLQQQQQGGGLGGTLGTIAGIGAGLLTGGASMIPNMAMLGTMGGNLGSAIGGGSGQKYQYPQYMMR